jgi:uncharacterized protein YutE (UPF0331/DUF86 family)
MNKKEITKLLERIEQIVKFQKKRINKKTAINKEITLKRALEFIEIDIDVIKEMLKCYVG